MILVLAIAAVIGVAVGVNAAGIKNLMGEPDYRKVRLHWESNAEDSTDNFLVRYCELQSWGSHRCRTKAVSEDENVLVRDENVKMYTKDIEGLRMATTYSFEVKPAKQGEREDRAEGDGDENTIVIPTKGFSARATQCLPEASEIEVSTGPHFGGRIAVEASDGERCVLDGEPDSARDTYTLRINHAECGSQVNETTVATFVIVQENLPILTHSTRRFLVLCSYQPETLTVRAGLNLPSGRGQSAPTGFDDNNSIRRGRNMRNGKMLLKPQALVQIEDDDLTTKNAMETQVLPIAIITMLAVAAIIGIIAVAIKLTATSSREAELDNVSMGSEVSTISCSTTADEEERPELVRVQ